MRAATEAVAKNQSLRGNERTRTNLERRARKLASLLARSSILRGGAQSLAIPSIFAGDSRALEVLHKMLGSCVEEMSRLTYLRMRTLVPRRTPRP